MKEEKKRWYNELISLFFLFILIMIMLVASVYLFPIDRYIGLKAIDYNITETRCGRGGCSTHNVAQFINSKNETFKVSGRKDYINLGMFLEDTRYFTIKNGSKYKETKCSCPSDRQTDFFINGHYHSLRCNNEYAVTDGNDGVPVRICGDTMNIHIINKDDNYEFEIWRW